MISLHCLKFVRTKKLLILPQYLFWAISKWRRIKHCARTKVYHQISACYVKFILECPIYTEMHVLKKCLKMDQTLVYHSKRK